MTLIEEAKIQYQSNLVACQKFYDPTRTVARLWTERPGYDESLKEWESLAKRTLEMDSFDFDTVMEVRCVGVAVDQTCSELFTKLEIILNNFYAGPHKEEHLDVNDPDFWIKATS